LPNPLGCVHPQLGDLLVVCYRVSPVFGPVLRDIPKPAATVNTRHLEAPSISAIWL
jgi:hypothetical protein